MRNYLPFRHHPVHRKDHPTCWLIEMWLLCSGKCSNSHCLNTSQLWTSAVAVAMSMFRRQTQNQYIIQTWKFRARQLNFAQVMFIFLCPLIGPWAGIATSDWPASDNGYMIPHCTSCICDVRSERESWANVKGPILEGTASIALCQSQIRLRPNTTPHCTDWPEAKLLSLNRATLI